MSRLEPADTIEAKVGAKRHPTDHIARAVSITQRVYLLHPQACLDETASVGTTLQDCPYSHALDRGIHRALWRPYQDQPVIVRIDQLDQDLTPYRTIPTVTHRKQDTADERL
ncbi:MAG: hypothetical protein PIR02_16015 [Microbacterium enclense]